MDQNRQQKTTKNGTIGLCLSGGGFRATLFHLGVVRYLMESNRLDKVHRICSISGGSILAAHLVLNWSTYKSKDDFEKAAKHVIKLVRSDLRGRIIRRWFCFYLAIALAIILILCLPVLLRMFSAQWSQFVYPYNYYGAAFATLLFILVNSRLDPMRAKLLARSYKRSLFRASGRIFFKNRAFRSTNEITRPDLSIIGTSLTNGEAYSVSGHGFRGHTGTAEDTVVETGGFDVGEAVAFSSSFPPLFPPVSITPRKLNVDRQKMSKQMLADGGVYDNSGVVVLRKLEEEDPTCDQMIISEAGKPFGTLAQRFRYLPSRAARSTDILMKRVLDLESRKNKSKETVISISDEILDIDTKRRIENIRTDLNSFKKEEIHLLVTQGYVAALKKLDDLEDISRDDIWTPFPKLRNKTPTQYARALRKSGTTRLSLFRIQDVFWWLLILLAMILIAIPGCTAWLTLAQGEVKLEPSFQLTYLNPASENEAESIYLMLQRANAKQLTNNTSGTIDVFFRTGKLLNYTPNYRIRAFNLKIPSQEYKILFAAIIGHDNSLQLLNVDTDDNDIAVPESNRDQELLVILRPQTKNSKFGQPLQKLDVEVMQNDKPPISFVHFLKGLFGNFGCVIVIASAGN